ncbi:MAG: helix-turn-helix domain-containing protein, partial [Defluviitaleaceae bacterium]|nr:helix-turn-helix domain-containing protein [Defluviitaleaceae bacterium]
IDADISKYAILTVKEDSNPTIKEIVKAVLVNARAKKGMTIFDLALKIEIPSSHIRDFELGKKDLKFETLEKIAKALDLDLKEFYR